VKTPAISDSFPSRRDGGGEAWSSALGACEFLSRSATGGGLGELWAGGPRHELSQGVVARAVAGANSALSAAGSWSRVARYLPARPSPEGPHDSDPRNGEGVGAGNVRTVLVLGGKTAVSAPVSVEGVRPCYLRRRRPLKARLPGNPARDRDPRCSGLLAAGRVIPTRIPGKESGVAGVLTYRCNFPAA
jgi:hypothetical protein